MNIFEYVKKCQRNLYLVIIDELFAFDEYILPT